MSSCGAPCHRQSTNAALPSGRGTRAQGDCILIRRAFPMTALKSAWDRVLRPTLADSWIELPGGRACSDRSTVATKRCSATRLWLGDADCALNQVSEFRCNRPDSGKCVVDIIHSVVYRISTPRHSE